MQFIWAFVMQRTVFIWFQSSKSQVLPLLMIINCGDLLLWFPYLMRFWVWTEKKILKVASRGHLFLTMRVIMHFQPHFPPGYIQILPQIKRSSQMEIADISVYEHTPDASNLMLFCAAFFLQYFFFFLLL